MRLGVLGVPLIMVPDSSPRASKGVLVLAWRLYRTFLRGDWPFSVILCSGVCARAHPPGVAPEASEEWFDSSEVLVPFVTSRAGMLTLSTVWQEPGLREPNLGKTNPCVTLFIRLRFVLHPLSWTRLYF